VADGGANGLAPAHSVGTRNAEQGRLPSSVAGLVDAPDGQTLNLRRRGQCLERLQVVAVPSGPGPVCTLCRGQTGNTSPAWRPSAPGGPGKSQTCPAPPPRHRRPAPRLCERPCPRGAPLSGSPSAERQPSWHHSFAGVTAASRMTAGIVAAPDTLLPWRPVSVAPLNDAISLFMADMAEQGPAGCRSDLDSPTWRTLASLSLY
jgi:hypothetical protein